MIVNFGIGILILSLLVTFFSLVAIIIGIYLHSRSWMESARRGMLANFPLLTITLGILIYLLVNHRYDVAYVYQVTDESMPLILKITALWGGQAGSILFWVWILAGCCGIYGIKNQKPSWQFFPWVVLVCMVTELFFTGISTFLENPFTRIFHTYSGNEIAALFPPPQSVPVFPANGNGLNPLLRHPGMIVHPPLLYFGFVLFIIPYAYAIAALISGNTEATWLPVARRWGFIAWVFLFLGLLVGARWAYEVLGWGGYWGWDPVEVSALLPWLSSSAFLHSAIIEEKSSFFKRWNMVLIILTYCLVLFGTFITRSGILSSVHSFSESRVGISFLIFISLTFIVSLGLLLYRWQALGTGDRLFSFFSRESLVLFNNLLFLGILIICFWGIIYPIVSELIGGQKITIGPPYYERGTAILFGGIFLLMSLAPISSWGYATFKSLSKSAWKAWATSITAVVITIVLGAHSLYAILGFWLISLVIFVTLYECIRSAYHRCINRGENFVLAFWRVIRSNPRRCGGYMIHIGVALIALGILGIELYQSETQGTLKPGERLSIAKYQITFASLASYDHDDIRTTRAVMNIYQGVHFLGQVSPSQDYYYASQQPITIPGIRSTLADDLYLVIVGWDDKAGQQVTIKAYHNPLFNWLWIGSAVFIIGTIIASLSPPNQKRMKLQP